MSSYHLVGVSVRDESRELIAARLWALGAAGLEERSGELIAAFDTRSNAERAQAELARGGSIRTVDEAFGLDEWRADATVVLAGPFAVHPPWLEPPQGAIALSIDPGHAFGSGSHMSTQLALRLLADEVEPTTTVVDIGCGSGVLSIAAARLGARVVAIDIHPAAVAATTHNVEANGLSENVDVLLGSVEGCDPPFDVALINVTVDVHELLASTVTGHLRPRRLIVSGLRAGAATTDPAKPSQIERCITAYSAQLTRELTDGEWAGLVLDLGHHE